MANMAGTTRIRKFLTKTKAEREKMFVTESRPSDVVKECQPGAVQSIVASSQLTL